jgi:hypothetical protein
MSDIYPSAILNHSSISNHYEVPNLTSMLYEYTNSEVDRIKYSFRTGNFISLRGDMPRHFLPGNVSQVSKSKIESNLYSHIQEKSYIELQNGGGFFSKFEYQSDGYDAWTEKQRIERIKNDELINKIHDGVKFISNPKVEVKHKHQNIFVSPLWGKDDENLTIGYLFQNDPYEANSFEVMRARWI